MTGAIIGRIARRLLRQPPRREIPPSFNSKFDAARRMRRLLLLRGIEHPVWGINDKDAAQAWAAEHGWRQPRLVGLYASAGEIPWTRLPDSVVIKPVHGSSSRGVVPLTRAGGGEWRRVADGTVVTPAAIVAHLNALAESGTTSRRILVETLVIDANTGRAPPIDWKVYAFHGEIGMVCGKRAGPDGNLWRYFDPDFNDLGAAVRRHVIDPTIAPPRHGREIVEMAREISAAIPVPMLRVDLYDAVEGATFGEITPEPGLTRRLVPEMDERLGRLWEDAEARILARLIGSGALDVTRGRPAGFNLACDPVETRELARHG